ncbi:MAG: LacI family DNA-binding transcriptional regulator [bacterium]|nr:LacI family DNA-binding transcriptional regulator [bacterium]
MARAAGVSKSLVSLAIRDGAGVSPQTRERILEVADRLGYRSNQWAQSLVRGRSHLVGVLLTDLRNPYHTDVVVGVEDAAAEQEMEVLISHGRRDPALLAERVRSLLRLGVDGLVVVSAHTPPEALAEAVRTTPVVVIGRPASVPDGISQLCNDDAAGARLAVEHLVGLGHESIVYLQNSRSVAARARGEAYEVVMRERGLAPRVIGDVEELGAASAVFASNDRGAVAMLGALHDSGLRVPEDVAVVGYDDTDLATIVRPQLTSVAQPRGEMGRRAMEILASDVVVREMLQPELVVRESTTPGVS